VCQIFRINHIVYMLFVGCLSCIELPLRAYKLYIYIDECVHCAWNMENESGASAKQVTKMPISGNEHGFA